jgi:hypothetical protein
MSLKMSVTGPSDKYDDDYLKAIFGLTSHEIRATGVSVEDYIVRNATKALRNPKARKVSLSKASPSRRAEERWQRLALKSYLVIFVSFGLLLISAIPIVERDQRVLTDVLRFSAGAGCLVAFGVAMPAFRSFFKFLKLRREDKHGQRDDLT